MSEEDERFLNVQQVADRYAVSTQTIWRWSKETDRSFPRPVGVSLGTSRWRLSELKEFEATLPALDGTASARKRQRSA